MTHHDFLHSPSGQRLLWLGRWEGLTLVGLILVAVPLKYLAQQALPVRILGPIHGLLFLLYLWHLWEAVGAGQVRPQRAWGLLLCSLLPGGFLLNERRR